MKWFKHESSAHNDELMRELVHEHGLEGYGFYVLVLELTAEKIDENLVPRVVIGASVMAEKCRMRAVKVELLSNYCATLGLFSFNKDGQKYVYECPNLLKRLDEYTEKSRHNREYVGHKKEREKKNKEGEREAPANVSHETILNPLNPKNLLANDLFASLTMTQREAICLQWPEDFLKNTLSRYISTAEQRKIFRMNPGTVFTWLERDFREAQKTVKIPGRTQRPEELTAGKLESWKAEAVPMPPECRAELEKYGIKSGV